MGIDYVEEAIREHLYLRAFFMGPTGSGKSLAALELASKLGDGSIPTTLINTEIGRGRLYADRYRYALIELTDDFGPEAYIHAVDLAEAKHPGATLVIDSSTHEWTGANGVLQQADRFGNWKTIRPLHERFVQRLLSYEGHVIATCRAKMKYDVSEEILDGGRKKQVITMLGVGPIQDGDLQYEFNLVARFDQDTHEATFSGHVDPLVGTTSAVVPADAVAKKLSAWLSEGTPPAAPPTAEQADVDDLVALLVEEGFAPEEIEAGFVVARRSNRGQLHPDFVMEKTTTALKRKTERENEPAEPKAA